MSSGMIDGQERAELEAAERGSRLIRPSTYQRETWLTRLTSEELSQESAWALANWIEHEEDHQRAHQATVEYLIRKAQGKRVSQKQLANEYNVTVRQISWRLAIYRGYDKEKYEIAFSRRKMELEVQREAQIRESGMYAPVLKHDQFIAELDQMVQSLEVLLTESDAMEAYHRACEILCDIVALFTSQFNRDELTDILSEIIIDTYGEIISRVERERPVLMLTSTRGFWELRYTPAQKHKYFMRRVKQRSQNMVNWLKEADIWQAYFHAGNELCQLVSLLIFQLQGAALTSREKRVASVFEVIAKQAATLLV